MNNNGSRCSTTQAQRLMAIKRSVIVLELEGSTGTIQIIWTDLLTGRQFVMMPIV